VALSQCNEIDADEKPDKQILLTFGKNSAKNTTAAPPQRIEDNPTVNRKFWQIFKITHHRAG
jgi:hypothetical protein